MVKKYPDLGNREHSNIAGKLNRESLRYKEAVELAKAEKRKAEVDRMFTFIGKIDKNADTRL